jgi:hypothetical protein
MYVCTGGEEFNDHDVYVFSCVHTPYTNRIEVL